MNILLTVINNINIYTQNKHIILFILCLKENFKDTYGFCN